MESNRLEKERDGQIRSGAKESPNPDRNDVIKNIDKNKERAIHHELYPDHGVKKPEFQYDEGTRGPSSD